MKSFLKEVALATVTRSKLAENTVYILPSKRAGLLLKKQFAELAGKPIFLPEVLSIEQLIENMAQLRLATNTELLFQLFLSYKNSHIKEKDDFFNFYKWAVVLLQDFNEIDRYLIDAKRLFSYLNEVKKLKEWGVQKKSSLISNYLIFWNELGSIYDDFRSRLLKKGEGYQGLIYRKAYENKADYLENAEGKHFIFIGFNALNKAESEIIQFFLDNSTSEIYWDIDSYFLNDPLHSASFFIRNYQKEWKHLANNPLKGISTNYLSDKNIQIFGVPKNVSQAKLVGALLEQKFNPNEKTALVLAHESLLDPILNSIPEEFKELNITMGKPLGETAIHTFILNFFALHSNRSKKGYNYQDVLRFFSSPYVALLLSKTNPDFPSRLKTSIKQNNWVYIAIEKIGRMENVPELVTRVLLSEGGLSAKNFTDTVLHLLSNLQTYLKENDVEAEIGLIDRFKTIVSELEILLSSYSFINDLKSIESVYNDLIANEKLDYQGNPYQGLQVMGMLESRNLDFDTVFITSVNEGILPAGKSINSFIPFDLKKEFSMPTFKEKDAVYAYHFYRLIQRAKNVYILYNTEPDVLEGGEKSRFITQMLTDENINKYISHKVGAPQINPTSLKPPSIEKTPRLINDLRILAQNGFSPSSLSEYISNPIAFYKKYVLKIKEVEEVDESMAYNTFGTIVHDALEQLYSPFVDSFLSSEKLMKRKAKIKEIIYSSFEKVLPGVNCQRGKNLIIFQVISKYIENFLDAEIDEAKKHKIKLLALEEELSCRINIEGLEFPVVLKGKLDRIDERDGQLRIIDYKTGKVENTELALKDWNDLIENKKYAKAFQLLCYARMYESTSASRNVWAGIVPIKKSKPDLMLFSHKEGNNSKIGEEVLAKFNLQLNKLIQEIMNPAIPFTEKE